MAGPQRDMTRAEESYAAQVKYQLRHMSHAEQTRLMQNVRRTLLGRQPSEGYHRLEKEMGPPAKYVDKLLGRGAPDDERHEAPPPKKKGLFGRR